MKNNQQKSKEFPEGKENYCPKCYFEDEKTILRKDCPHNTPNPSGWEKDNLEFHQLALKVKKWFEDRDIDTGYTDTYVGHFAIYIKDLLNSQKSQLLEEVEGMIEKKIKHRKDCPDLCELCVIKDELQKIKELK